MESGFREDRAKYALADEIDKETELLLSGRQTQRWRGPLVRRGVGRAAREAGDLARFLRTHSLDDNDAAGKLGHYDVGAIRAWYEAKKFPPLGEHARAALAEPQPGGSRNFDVAKKVSALMVALIADFGPPNLD